MKSVIGTIIIFIGLYVIITNDVLSFFAQKSVTIFAISAIAVMLIVAVLVLGLPFSKKKGGHHDKDSEHLN